MLWSGLRESRYSTFPAGVSKRTQQSLKATPLALGSGVSHHSLKWDHNDLELSSICMRPTNLEIFFAVTMCRRL
eukprot:8595855-Pyramimonas_sp.AAC.1